MGGHVGRGRWRLIMNLEIALGLEFYFALTKLSVTESEEHILEPFRKLSPYSNHEWLN